MRAMLLRRRRDAQETEGAKATTRRALSKTMTRWTGHGMEAMVVASVL